MKFSQLHRNIKVRVITSFFSKIVGTMIFPFMAIYFSRELGAALTGILLLIVVALSIISSLYGGYLADKIGRKKVMATSLTIIMISYAVMAFANSTLYESVWLTYFMYVFINISSSLSSPASEALLVDSSTKENRTYMYSLTYWSMNVSIMIGSFFGSFLFNEHRFELFVAMSCTTLFTLLMVAFVMTESYVPPAVVEKVHVVRDIVNSYKVVVKDKAYLAFTLGLVFLFSLEEHGSNFIAVRLAKEFKPMDLTIFHFPTLHIDGVNIVGFLLTENTFLVVVVTMFVVNWIRKGDPKKMLFFGLFIHALAYVFLGFTNSVIIIFIAGLVNTLGEIIYTPVQSSIKAGMMKESARGAYSAFSNFSYQLVRLIAVFGITLYSWIGSYGMSLFIALSGLTAFLLFRYSFKLSEEKEQEQIA